MTIHQEVQDEAATGWIRLLELIDDAANHRREEFSPLREMTPEQWVEIVTLPTSIAKLKHVKKFTLYGSSLVRIPPEIGEMTNLEEFSPYTSYRPKTCSKCNGEFADLPIQRWTSLRMGSDIVPLLVHACSEKCIDSIRDAPDNYVTRPHSGGLTLKQPDTDW